MKLKTIAALCKKSQNIAIMEKPAGGGNYIKQWIGDGYAMYPIAGLPYLDEESIFTIFDVTEKQRENYSFHQGALPEAINFSDTDANERMLDSEKMSIVVAGRTLIPLKTQYGMVFIDEKYLAPLAEAAEVLELYERITNDGRAYIAAKAGFMLIAVIMPCDIIKDDFVAQLRELTNECAVALNNKKSKETAAQEPEQTTFGGIKFNPVTGEVIEE